MNYLNNAGKDWKVRAAQIETRTGDGIVTLGQSYFQVPIGTSGERPPVPVSGAIRYNTTLGNLEYYNGATSSWVSVSAPPQIASVVPFYVADLCSNVAVTDASVNVTGINFGALPPSVSWLGNDSLTSYNAVATNINPGFNINVTVPQGVFDTSNLSPYLLVLSNLASGLSTTFPNAIQTHAAPFFTTSPNLGTFVQGFPLLGNISDLSGIDPEGLPIVFSSPDLSSATSGSMLLETSGSFIGAFPTGSTQTVGFQGIVTDSSNAFSTRDFLFSILENYTFNQTGGTLSFIDTLSGEGNTLGGAPTFGSQPNASALITYLGTNGTFTPANLDIPIEYLVVGGGGGGGASAWSTGGASGGGGGGGEVAHGYFTADTTTYNITVGTGGTRGIDNNTAEATNGNNSSLGSITALGGGFGGTSNGGIYRGNDGGCGGGGAYNGNITKIGGKNTGQYYGQSGGNSYNDNGAVFGSGGGGGAWKPGNPATLSSGGIGGDGFDIATSGTYVHYGSGGGGGAFDAGGSPPGGAGGADSGGAGGTNATSGVGQQGVDGQGGGGGGGSYNGSHQDGGDGGNGVVMIRFPYYKQIPLNNLNSISVQVASGYYTISYVDSANNFITYPKSDGYTIYTFRAENTGATNALFTITPESSISNISYLVVAGGGSGGGGTSDQVGSAGGGAGGYRLGVDPSDTSLSSNQSGGPSTVESALTFSSTPNVTITVGQGGIGPAGNVIGRDGSNSTIVQSPSISIISIGGGGGGDSGGSGGSGRNGGSGGGCNAFASTFGTGTTGQGNNGAKTGSSIAGGGGGGGASQVGLGGTGGSGNPPGIGGDGGDGLASNIQGGGAITRAGGGGGGSYTTITPYYRGGEGGLGGGGSGGTTAQALARAGLNGVSGTGGGGGGVSLGTTNSASNTGGNGGSGVVIIRFRSFK